jgi:hypothetical protein
MAMVLYCSTAVSLHVKSSSIIPHLYTCSYNTINSVRDLHINLYTNILNHLDMYKKRKEKKKKIMVYKYNQNIYISCRVLSVFFITMVEYLSN